MVSVFLGLLVGFLLTFMLAYPVDHVVGPDALTMSDDFCLPLWSKMEKNTDKIAI